MPLNDTPAPSYRPRPRGTAAPENPFIPQDATQPIDDSAAQDVTSSAPPPSKPESLPITQPLAPPPFMPGGAGVPRPPALSSLDRSALSSVPTPASGTGYMPFSAENLQGLPSRPTRAPLPSLGQPYHSGPQALQDLS